ncbi:hypothetical protein RHGRI_030604 [Rhododendron griersonianum]|uniref:Uncharacterized protein n=1 Tax=Rhododendron griersonianum TaxID=479676 RepID=A0AAV6I4N4_9ERIC|nr:hypothetical protein RHGRI_030604 [Rhododendron griersonianum]
MGGRGGGGFSGEPKGGGAVEVVAMENGGFSGKVVAYGGGSVEGGCGWWCRSRLVEVEVLGKEGQEK